MRGAPPIAAVAPLALTACLIVHAAPAAGAERRFAVVVHVASTEPDSVEDRLQVLLEAAERLFEPAEIGFTVEERRTLDACYATLETIRERRKLSRFFVPGAINVFLVDEILDPVPSEATRRAARAQGRAPSGRLSGAHVPINGRKPDTYIIIARTRSSVSLAHELGHFFGVAHSVDPQNVMSYGSRRDRFDDTQLEVFRRKAARFRRTRWVRSFTASSVAAASPGPVRWNAVAGARQIMALHRGPRI